MKRSQEAEFDVSKAENRILRNKTVPDGPRGCRVAPYRSTVKVYREMIDTCLQQAPGRQATVEEICHMAEQDELGMKLHIEWAQHARKRPWKRTLAKRIEGFPEFVKVGTNSKGQAIYGFAGDDNAGPKAVGKGKKVPGGLRVHS